MSEPDEQMQQALDGVASLLEQVEPGVMVQRFVLVAEVFDTDGERAVWMLIPPGTQAQDTLGLLRYAQTVEEANLHRRQADDD